ncbi:alpha/beta hydrolase [Marinibacterium sp. SX1]|uniref:alpha/beta hydrolase n=1 Tax=Marinibacterium sp. SX1 TaxID=3388424 RepID=UPI003D162594
MASTRPIPAWRNLTALAICLSATAAEVQAQAAPLLAERAPRTQSVQVHEPFGPGDTIADILTRPEFAGYARRLLPWADRAYDGDMPITRMARLLPYHSEVRSDVVLAGLNRILAAQQSGVPVFRDIYTKTERNEVPSLNEAGLFFFPGQPGAPFALIAPGGGFSYVGSVHEGFPYAMALADQGFNAFVVTYRTGQGGRVATSDMARAVDVIMDNADELDVAREGYSVWGSSAGARMAAFIGSHGPDGFGARTTQRPAAVVMAYTSHSDLGDHEPPTYAIVGARDGIAPPGNMRPRVEALRAMGIDVEFHIVPDAAHGFGAGQGTRADGWITEAAAFWQRHLPEGVLRPMEDGR